jgi:hypothetical protein
MSKYLPWDFDNPAHRQRRRRQPPILEGEIIEPQSEPRVHRVTVEHVYHRREGISPQRIVIVAAFAILALVLLRSPGALIMLAVLIPSWLWLAAAFIVAVLVIASIRERNAGRKF